MTDFGSVLFALADSGVNFVIVGAYAAYAQGATSAEGALDICYDRTPENIRRLSSALTPFHLRLRGVADGVPFTPNEQTLTQGVKFALQTKIGAIDLLGELSGVGQFPALVPDAISVVLHGRSLRVASMDSIIRSKRAAGRPKDLNALPELEALKELQEETNSKKTLR